MVMENRLRAIMDTDYLKTTTKDQRRAARKTMTDVDAAADRLACGAATAKSLQ